MELNLGSVCWIVRNMKLFEKLLSIFKSAIIAKGKYEKKKKKRVIEGERDFYRISKK